VPLSAARLDAGRTARPDCRDCTAPARRAGLGRCDQRAPRLQEVVGALGAREVTCLYNDVNWWLEGLVKGDALLDNLAGTERADYFL
jgi:hypothetical protein